jgi:hypothetical protein
LRISTRKPARPVNASLPVDRIHEIVEHPGAEHVVWASSPAGLRSALSGSAGFVATPAHIGDVCLFGGVLRESTSWTGVVLDLLKIPDEHGVDRSGGSSGP